MVDFRGLVQSVREDIEAGLRVPPGHPDTMYHLTKDVNVAAILKEGLRPAMVRSTGTGFSHGVYLGEDPGELMSGVLHDFLGYPAVLTVDVRGLELFFDPEFYAEENSVEEIIERMRRDNDIGYYVYSKDSIPPSRIEFDKRLSFRYVGGGVFKQPPVSAKRRS